MDLGVQGSLAILDFLEVRVRPSYQKHQVHQVVQEVQHLLFQLVHPEDQEGP